MESSGLEAHQMQKLGHSVSDGSQALARFRTRLSVLLILLVLLKCSVPGGPQTHRKELGTLVNISLFRIEGLLG